CDLKLRCSCSCFCIRLDLHRINGVPVLSIPTQIRRVSMLPMLIRELNADGFSRIAPDLKGIPRAVVYRMSFGLNNDPIQRITHLIKIVHPRPVKFIADPDAIFVYSNSPFGLQLNLFVSGIGGALWIVRIARKLFGGRAS